MGEFYTLMGFGFVLLCLTSVIVVAAIFGYVVHISMKDKKIEVAPAKVNSNKTTDE